MYKAVTDIINGFKQSWKQYLFQSFLATIVIFGVFLALRLERLLITVSIGATAFIIFAMPKNITASPKNVIGGHMVGFIAGFLFALIPHKSFLFSAFIYSLAVGFSIFMMVTLNVEHPPASATALGVAMKGFSWKIAIFFFISVTILLIVQFYFKRFLQCLVYGGSIGFYGKEAK